MSRSFLAIALAGAVGAACFVGLAAADTTADNAIKYRKAVMGGVGANTKAIAMIAKGEVEHGEAFAAHARMLATAASLATAAFRQNTHGEGSEKTTAIAKVWDDWAEFEKGLKAMESEAGKLADLAEAGDMDGAKSQLGNVGKTCKACHDDFRDK